MASLLYSLSLILCLQVHTKKDLAPASSSLTFLFITLPFPRKEVDWEATSRSKPCKGNSSILMKRVIMPNYASPECADWETNVLHVRACGFGSVFLNTLEQSSLCEKDRIALLEVCRRFVIACIKSVMKRLPANMQLLNDLLFLKPGSITQFSFDSFYKAFSPFIQTSVISAMESEYRLLQTNIRDLSDDCLELFWKKCKGGKKQLWGSHVPVALCAWHRAFDTTHVKCRR